MVRFFRPVSPPPPAPPATTEAPATSTAVKAGQATPLRAAMRVYHSGRLITSISPASMRAFTKSSTWPKSVGLNAGAACVIDTLSRPSRMAYRRAPMVEVEDPDARSMFSRDRLIIAIGDGRPNCVQSRPSTPVLTPVL